LCGRSPLLLPPPPAPSLALAAVLALVRSGFAGLFLRLVNLVQRLGGGIVELVGVTRDLAGPGVEERPGDRGRLVAEPAAAVLGVLGLGLRTPGGPRRRRALGGRGLLGLRGRLLGLQAQLVGQRVPAGFVVVVGRHEASGTANGGRYPGIIATWYRRAPLTR